MQGIHNYITLNSGFLRAGPEIEMRRLLSLSTEMILRISNAGVQSQAYMVRESRLSLLVLLHYCQLVLGLVLLRTLGLGQGMCEGTRGIRGLAKPRWHHYALRDDPKLGREESPQCTENNYDLLLRHHGNTCAKRGQHNRATHNRKHKEHVL